MEALCSPASLQLCLSAVCCSAFYSFFFETRELSPPWTRTIVLGEIYGKTVGRGQESQRVLPSWSWFIIFSPSTGFDSLRQVATSSTDSDDHKHQILLNSAGLLLKHAPHHTLIFHWFSSEVFAFIDWFIDIMTVWWKTFSDWGIVLFFKWVLNTFYQ